jgi:phosphate transport system substrate-binding protein
MLRGLLAVGIALLAVQATCRDAGAQAAPGAGGTLGIHGSNTIGARLMPSLVEAYAASIGASVMRKAGDDPEQVELQLTSRAGNPLALIDIRAHGSGTAVPGLISGKATIGMASRPITDKEVEALNKAGWPDLRSPAFERVVALDGVLVLVAPDNPLTSLTMDQIAAIFAGTISDWVDVGRAPGPIHIYARDNKSGTYDTFNALVLAARKLALRKDAKRFESSEDLSDEVSRDPNGICFVGFAYLRNAKALDITGDCGISSTPNTFNVKSEEYPLSRRLFLYAKGLPKGTIADDLLRYAQCPWMRAPASRARGYIDQEVEFLDRREQMMRLADSLALNDARIDPAALKELALDTKSSRRMSTTFRFARGSSQLDSKSVLDIARLARFVQFLVERREPRTLVLAGFTDSTGDFAPNAALSLARAKHVRDTIVREAKVPVPANMIVTRGYGPLLPTSCNDTEDGRHKNRRVESWLR